MGIKHTFLKLVKLISAKSTGTFMVFLLISTGLWLVMSLNDTERNDYRLNIVIKSLPQGVTVTTPRGELPTVTVAVNEKALDHLIRNITGQRSVEIDFTDFELSPGNRLTMSPTALATALRQEFASTTELLAIMPDSLSIPFTNEKPHRLPVKLNTDIGSAEEFTVSSITLTQGDSVDLYVNGDITNFPTAISTETLKLRQLTDTTTVRLAIKTAPNTRAIPDSVTVRIDVEPLVAKSFQCPITVINNPAGTEIVTFPSQAQVTLLLPLSRYNMDVNNLRVEANYLTAADNRMQLIVELPDPAFTSVSIDPQWIEFIETE